MTPWGRREKASVQQAKGQQRKESAGEDRAEQLLRAALEYAARGWAVFPVHTSREDGTCSCRSKTCSAVGKHPRTRKGLNDAARDQEKIAEWWKRWPDANIGVATGNASGIVVLDLDDPASPDLQRLEEAFPGLFETLISETSRGRHYWYKSNGIGPVKNSVKRLGEGIDVRGDGGYVVAPPSKHASGFEYRWMNQREPAAFPPQLGRRKVQSMVAATTPTRLFGPVQVAAKVVAEAPEGERNHTLNRQTFFLGVQVKNGELREDQIAAAMLTAAMKAGLDETEAKATIGSALRAAKERPDTRGAPQYTWVWQDRVALKHVTLISGQVGVGKSLLAAELAARVSRGELSGNLEGTRGNVLYLSLKEAESDQVTEPRLIVAGADFSTVDVLYELGSRLAPKTVIELDSAVSSNTKLVVIDELMDFTPKFPFEHGKKKDWREWNDQLASDVIGHLKEFAAKRNVAILLVQAAAGSRIERVPTMKFVVEWNHLKDVRRVRPKGSSISAPSEVYFHVRSGDMSGKSVPQLVWVAPARTAVEEGIAWLRNYLVDGPKRSDEVRTAAKAAGLSDWALRKAKKSLNVAARQLDGGGKGWSWTL
jgi:hypothetical protein